MKLIKADKSYYVRDKHGSLRKVSRPIGVGKDKVTGVPHIPTVKEKKDEQKDH